jgi:CheY-like chemotaxis protein
MAARRAHPGLDVRTVNNGLDGLAYLRGLAPFEDRTMHPIPNLVILDLYMPELDGFEVLSWIREYMKDAEFPVVVLTASVEPGDEARALQLGATSVHQKPNELQLLGDVVSEIVQKWIGRGEMIAAHIWSEG